MWVLDAGHGVVDTTIEEGAAKLVRVRVNEDGEGGAVSG